MSGQVNAKFVCRSNSKHVLHRLLVVADNVFEPPRAVHTLGPMHHGLMCKHEPPLTQSSETGEVMKSTVVGFKNDGHKQ